MSKLFDPDGILFRWAVRLFDLAVLSVLWIVCSMPLLTLIPSCIALYDTVVHCILSDEGAMYRHFFASYRKHLKRGLILSLIPIGTIVLVYMGLQIIAQQPALAAVKPVLLAVYMVAGVLAMGFSGWIVALSAGGTEKIRSLLQDAAVLTFGKLPVTLAVTGLLILQMLLVYIVTPLILVLPAWIASKQCRLTEHVLLELQSE